MHAKSCKTRRMFQWDAVDTSRDLGGQNVPPPKKNFRNGYLTKQTDDTDGITDSFLSLALFSLTFKIIFLAVLRRGHPPYRAPHGSATAS